jgi:hypothetical protein
MYINSSLDWAINEVKAATLAILGQQPLAAVRKVVEQIEVLMNLNSVVKQ